MLEHLTALFHHERPFVGVSRDVASGHLDNLDFGINTEMIQERRQVLQIIP